MGWTKKEKEEELLSIESKIKDLKSKIDKYNDVPIGLIADKKVLEMKYNRLQYTKTTD
jgi:hypothetical protein